MLNVYIVSSNSNEMCGSFKALYPLEEANEPFFVGWKHF